MEESRVSQSFQKLFSYSAIIVVGWVELRETCESEPSLFRVMNIPKSHRQPDCHQLTLRIPGGSSRLPQRFFQNNF